VVLHSGILLAGRFRLVRGKLHYHLTPHFQEELGIETIIFQRVEDYEPIDPEWIANFVPRPE